MNETNQTDEHNTRLRVLASFLRSQALLTDVRPHVPGAGGVNLNRDEALLLARAIDELRQGEHYLLTIAGYLHEQAQVPGKGGATIAGDISVGHHDALLIADAVDLLVDCRRAPA